jgi:two-component system NtrC family response regulator
MAVKTILFVDDDEVLRQVVTHHLEEAGYRVLAESRGSDGLKTFDATPPDLVITDIQMAEMDGFELIARIRAAGPDIPIITVTAFASVDSAVQAMKLGADDYLTKPFKKEVLLHSISKALQCSELLQENRALRRFVGEYFTLENIIGTSKPMRDVYEIVQKVARTPVTVLITGESGTGKELMAKAIHQNSSRSGRSFVPINCAAIPEGLVESEFFGHKKGSFTGAHADAKGKLEMADGGTLFLDEVGDLPLPMQTKLLRVFQDGEFFRVGDSTPRHADVRFIAATNRDLVGMTKDKSFREELYFRLNVVPIRLPSLRERRDDIPLLADHFLKEASLRYGRPQIRFTKDSLNFFQNFSWPGNIRQLQNTVERMVVLANGNELGLQDVPDEIRKFQKNGSAANLAIDLPEGGLDLENLERDVIHQALERHDWNQTATSKYLNITRSMLITRMQRYELSQPANAPKAAST